MLDAEPEMALDANGNSPDAVARQSNGTNTGNGTTSREKSKIFVASVSPQVRASLAATYGISHSQAGQLIERFLSGPDGLRAGGAFGNGFTWVVDTNVMREVCLELSAREVVESLSESGSGAKMGEEGEADSPPAPRLPILASACPGWICYAEKTHPHVLPHLSRLKSPQALTGTFLKSVLSKTLGVSPSRIWHLAVMPCFDKKLEASRGELTSKSWQGQQGSSGCGSSGCECSHDSNNNNNHHHHHEHPARDVDCVITAKELLMLADSRGISLPSLLSSTSIRPAASLTPFPSEALRPFFFPAINSLSRVPPLSQTAAAGPSGGFLHHILNSFAVQHPGSAITTRPGRNADVVEHAVIDTATGTPLLRTARYYGFRNIQNLVRRLKPARPSRLPGAAKPRTGATASKAALSSSTETAANTAMAGYAYVEVMACPGGCTNGGGQIRLEDAREAMETRTPVIETEAITNPTRKPAPSEQRAWLARVDEAYFSASDEDETIANTNGEMGVRGLGDVNNGLKQTSSSRVDALLSLWTDITGIPLPKLVYTTYQKVESDVGKDKGVDDTTRVVELAGKIDGGW